MASLCCKPFHRSPPICQVPKPRREQSRPVLPSFAYFMWRPLSIYLLVLRSGAAQQCSAPLQALDHGRTWTPFAKLGAVSCRESLGSHGAVHPESVARVLHSRYGTATPNFNPPITSRFGLAGLAGRGLAARSLPYLPAVM